MPTASVILAEGLAGSEWGIVGVVVVALLGLVAWSLRQTIAVVIPNIIATHGKAAETVAVEQSKATVATVAAHADTTRALIVDAKESRQFYQTIIDREREACDRRHAESQAAIDRRHEENLAVIKDMVDGLKESRHGMKALHNAFGVHAALVEDALERLELKKKEEGKPK